MECSQQRCTRGCGDAPGCSSRKVFPHRVRGGALAAARLWGPHVSAARGQLVPGSARGVCPLPPVQLSPPALGLVTRCREPFKMRRSPCRLLLAPSLSLSLSQLSAAAVSVPSSLVFVPAASAEEVSAVAASGSSTSSPAVSESVDSDESEQKSSSGTGGGGWATGAGEAGTGSGEASGRQSGERRKLSGTDDGPGREAGKSGRGSGIKTDRLVSAVGPVVALDTPQLGVGTQLASPRQQRALR